MRTKFLLIILLFTIKQVTAQSNLIDLSNQLQQEYLNKDTLFKKPYIDIDEWREKPVRHHYIHGGFKGTETRFSFYFPQKTAYKGRFFQYITPFPDNEFLSQATKGEDDIIRFSIEKGAYFIETNGGGKVDFAKPNLRNDPTIGAYRANAACAIFSRVIAKQLFGGKRPFGYAFGGSGGAYRTIGSIENTSNVWDGVVPFVLGSPMAIPNVFSVRMNAMRILHDKLPGIIDAMDAGGSGDMYAGLNQEEREALEEATNLGFPPQSWFNYKKMGIHGFIALYQGMKMIDPSFFTDFWTSKGYLGATPTASLLKARIQKKSKIKSGLTSDEAIKLKLKEPETEGERGSADLAWKSIGGVEGALPVGFVLEDALPDVNFLGGDLKIISGEAKGKVIQLATIDGNKVVFGPADMSVLVKIKAGDEVEVDNSNFLAVQTYHRHQVPGKEYKVWDYFRDENGQPKYPQRPMLIGPLFTMGAAGVLPTGKFNGKMILLCSLLDREAFPWQGDFYRQMVNSNLKENADHSFRLWYTDHAVHGDSKQEDQTRVVSYSGVLLQALLDVSDWAEKGIEPPLSTNYTIKQGQVIVPKNANERKGIQATVNLLANGSKKAIVKAGDAISFSAQIDLPENTGNIVNAKWDFDGSGNFAEKQNLKGANKLENKAIKLTRTYKFIKPGTYFVTLKVASQRKENQSSIFGKVYNLDRVRVIVESRN
ncbi:PKD domain-containing protein [Aquirufa sp. Wall-65K1]